MIRRDLSRVALDAALIGDAVDPPRIREVGLRLRYRAIERPPKRR